MLTLPENLLLLMSDDNHGRSAGISPEALSAGFVAAALMELAIRNRIDSDLESVWVTDNSPTGDASIDEVLAQLSAGKFSLEASELIERMTSFGQTIRHAALARLQDRDIVKVKKGLLSLITGHENYFIVDQRPGDELTARLRKILLSDEFPSPREICLLSLTNTLGLTSHIVPNADRTQIESRLATLAKMDLIGQGINGCLDSMFQKLAAVYQGFPRC